MSDPTTIADIQKRITFLKGETAFWTGLLARKSCHDCAHGASAPGCALAGGQTPPEEVRKTGCPAWTYDQIPF